MRISLLSFLTLFLTREPLLALPNPDWEALKSRALEHGFFEGQIVTGNQDFITTHSHMPPDLWVNYLTKRGFKILPAEQSLAPQTLWPPSTETCLFLKHTSKISIHPSTVCSVVNTGSASDTQSQLIGAAWNESQNPSPSALFRGNPLMPSEWITTEPRSLFHLHDKTPLLFDPAQLSEVPYACLQSILTTEDKKFLEHKGIDYKGIARAFVSNLQAGRFVQGGSTLTQQYIKNAFLSSEKTLSRKLLEARLSLWIEKHLTKDQILERYLNVVYFGNVGPFEIRGVRAASQVYFNKPISQLDWPQCLVLAALLKGPNQFHPIKKAQALKTRYLTLLDLLIQDAILKPEDKVLYQNLPLIHLSLSSSEILNGSSFLSAASGSEKETNHEQVKDIQLSMVTWLQSQTQEITSDYLKNLNPKLEASVVIANRHTGHILAAINGKDPNLSPYPRASRSKRQIGSLIKPYIFYQHFLKNPEQGPLSLVTDEPIQLKMGSQKWSPQNYDKKFYGPVSLEFALSKSLNIPAVKLGYDLNFPEWFEGHSQPSLLLGAIELSPLEVTQLYLKIEHGRRTPTHFYLNDHSLDRQSPSQNTLSHEARDKVWSILRKASIDGTSKAIGQNAILKGRAFGKTGTTSGFRDSWFAGFLDQYLIVVWLGADNNQDIQLTGSTGALPLFIKVAENLSSQALH